MTDLDDRVFEQFTIYRQPRDLPGVAFCVRQWLIRPHPVAPETGWVLVATSLAGARDLVPARADACLPRAPIDDPCIVETWM